MKLAALTGVVCCVVNLDAVEPAAAQGVLKVDPATAGAITGRVASDGVRPVQTTSLSFTFRKRP